MSFFPPPSAAAPVLHCLTDLLLDIVYPVQPLLLPECPSASPFDSVPPHHPACATPLAQHTPTPDLSPVDPPSYPETSCGALLCGYRLSPQRHPPHRLRLAEREASTAGRHVSHPWRHDGTAAVQCPCEVSCGWMQRLPPLWEVAVGWRVSWLMLQLGWAQMAGRKPSNIELIAQMVHWSRGQAGAGKR